MINTIDTFKFILLTHNLWDTLDISEKYNELLFFSFKPETTNIISAQIEDGTLVAYNAYKMKNVLAKVMDIIVKYKITKEDAEIIVKKVLNGLL